ncbi:PLP-dependent aminotransferase family protein [Liquorilactobacillus oeni]|uniref:HTH containing DNA-binding domain and MocR-like aminotransferase n=1 Tax=Liquorilactobacillus oeni DSM 19972 TaxID=1423777 RepID=A0A0R1MGD0_9LACO|nr:PLP-dependent aminotransferase family protein [Liquorilactobacillus oeni]KRL04964.1 HTH containing DNA-binding domain and MocR-like aminotransferase [Liquorilactobacillus oeni DSM 19972]
MIPTFSHRINQDSSSLDELFKLSAQANKISFAGGYPDPNLFPKDELKRAFEKRINDESNDLFQYRTVTGYEPLRQKIASSTKKMGFDCSSEEIMLTQGAQQGIKLLSSLFLDDHDGIAVEAPTYVGALEAFNEHLPKYYEIPMEKDGMDLETLENTLQHNKIKIIYTIPNFQNPTGYCMSTIKRKRLAALAAKYQAVVIEDDPYRELRYEGSALPAIKSFDRTGNVITLGSFSKILSPALRCGWLIASPEIVKQLSSLRLSYDCQSSNVLLESIDQYLGENSIEKHIDHLRRAYRLKMQTMLTCLEDELPTDCSFSHPQGGFFIWVTLPQGCDAAILLKQTNIVTFLEGSSLFANSSPKNYIRLNFTGVSLSEIKKGCADLGEAIKYSLVNQFAI